MVAIRVLRQVLVDGCQAANPAPRPAVHRTSGRPATGLPDKSEATRRGLPDKSEAVRLGLQNKGEAVGTNLDLQYAGSA